MIVETGYGGVVWPPRSLRPPQVWLRTTGLLREKVWEAYPMGRPGSVASARRPKRPRFLAVRVCHFLLRVRTWQQSPGAPRAALRSGNAITNRWVWGALRVFPEHCLKLCYVRCGTKSKRKLERRGGRTPLHLHLPTSVAAQPQHNTHRRES
jgi:hypothetical protein